MSTIEDPTLPRDVAVTLSVSESALRRVRAGFNPDKLTEIGQIHLLAAALITLLETHNVALPRLPDDVDEYGDHVVRKHERDSVLAGEQNRHVALAVAYAEAASMFGVKAATTHTYADRNMR